MKILEFTGAPGIGKSTLCNQLQKALIQKGYKVINMQRYLSGNTLFQKIYRKYRYHMIWHVGINRNIVRALRKLNFTSDSDHKEWIERILLINYQLHKQGKEYDYILLDEGIIQFITSLYHTKNMNNPVEIRHIIDALCPEYLQNTEIINMTLNLDQVCKRLKHRNRIGDRFLFEDEDQMKKSLVQKLDNIAFTLDVSGMPVFTLNCDNSPSAFQVQEIIKNCI